MSVESRESAPRPCGCDGSGRRWRFHPRIEKTPCTCPTGRRIAAAEAKIDMDKGRA